MSWHSLWAGVQRVGRLRCRRREHMQSSSRRRLPNSRMPHCSLVHVDLESTCMVRYEVGSVVVLVSEDEVFIGQAIFPRWNSKGSMVWDWQASGWLRRVELWSGWGWRQWIVGRNGIIGWRCMGSYEYRRVDGGEHCPDFASLLCILILH